MKSRVAIALLALFLVLGVGPSGPRAASPVSVRPSPTGHGPYTFAVTTTDDAHDAKPGDGRCATATGQCSLRAALEEASALSDDVTVTVPIGTFKLSLGSLSVQAHGHLSVKGGHSLHPIVNQPIQATAISAASPGTILIIRSGDVSLTDLLIGDGRGGNGGAIHSARGASLRMADVELLGNVGANGGAIANDGTLTIEDSTFGGNVSVDDPSHPDPGGGGAIFNTGTLTVTGTTFHSNMASVTGLERSGGGAIFNTGQAIVMHSSFDSNISTATLYGANGGAVFNTGFFEAQYSTLTANEAVGTDSAGGALYSTGKVFLSESTFSHNRARIGGAIANRGNSQDSMTLRRSSVSDNEAQSGGGIENRVGGFLIDTSRINNNRAVGDPGISGSTGAGGGLIIESDYVATILDSTISGNAADIGAGIDVDVVLSTFSITESTISGNIAGGSGGGIYNTGNLTVVNATISGNSANTTGGGMANVAGWMRTVQLLNVTVSDNRAAQGGGLYNQKQTANAHLLLEDTLLANNPAGGSCYGRLTSLGYNLDSDGSCGLHGPGDLSNCLLYTSPSPRDLSTSRMPSSA